MTTDAAFQKVLDTLKKAELMPKTEEHLRVFLFSMMEDPEFKTFLKISDSNPAVFDAFVTAFRHKRHFLEHGGPKEDWDYVLEKEKDVLELLEKK